MYANQMDLGHGNFGYEAAAQFYFGKHLAQLTLPEAALLGRNPQVALGLYLPNPSRLRP